MITPYSGREPTWLENTNFALNLSLGFFNAFAYSYSAIKLLASVTNHEKSINDYDFNEFTLSYESKSKTNSLLSEKNESYDILYIETTD